MSKSIFPNWINIYHEKVDSGEVLVSNKMKQQIERVKYMQENYIYDEKKANMKIDFIEKLCCHYKGDMARKPLLLSLWQKYILAVTFGFVDEEGYRIVKEVAIVVARKNGKTTFMAGVGLSCLMFDKEEAPEIYSVATKKDQAKLLYTDAYQMVQMSEDLNNEIRKRRTDLECTFNNGKMEPLANDSNSLDGLNIHLAVFDELHAYKDQNIIDVVQSSQGSRKQPLIVFITTNGTTRGKVFDDRYDYYSRILSDTIEDYSVQPFIFEQDDLKEINDPETWVKSNPNMDISVSKNYLAQQLKKANDDPKQRVGVLTKNFNFPQNETTAFFTELQCRINTFDENLLHGSTGVMGLDMAYTGDITVLTYLTWQGDKEYIKQWFIIPEGTVEEKSKTDKINYRELEDQGIIIFPGDRTNQIDVINFILEKLTELNIRVLKFGIDPYHAEHILTTFRSEYGDETVIAIHNSYTKKNTPTIYETRAMLENKEIFFNSKLTSLHLAGCMMNEKKDDSITLEKLHRYHRIDGAWSLIYARRAKIILLTE
jgi:phage terminase large subunit-like protein